MANCSSSGLRSLSRASPSAWSNDGGRPVRDGEPSCVIMLQTLPPWTCLLSRTLVSICSMPSLSCGSIVGTSRGSVTTNPTAEWVARQITEAFPWDGAPGYMIRDRDRIYGTVVTRRLRVMGIRDKPIAPASPWQNGFVERLIGSIRRECVDHIIILGEAHLRRILKSYASYYNEIRTHRSLGKDAPISRPVQRAGSLKTLPILGGLHHHYFRA
jgi:hypothetical protein